MKLQDAAKLIEESPTLKAEMAADPAGTLKKLAVSAPIPDTTVYRIVVGALALVVVLAMVGALYLAMRSANGTANIPDLVTALGSGALGALAGLLAPSPLGGQE
jgi:hypothetical protein